jgi:hypothetical protein
MNKPKKFPSQIISQNTAIRAALLTRRYSQLKVGQKQVIQPVMDIERSQVLEMLTAILSRSAVSIHTKCAS